MNILGVALSQAWGGLEQVALQDTIKLHHFFERLKNQGEFDGQIKLLVLEGSRLDQELLKLAPSLREPLSFRPKNFLDFKLGRFFKKKITEGLTHIHLHQSTLLPTVIPFIWNIPQVSLVVSRHIVSGYSKKNPFHWFLYRRVNAWVAMSEYLQKNILETFPVNPNRVEVIPLGLDLEKFKPLEMKPQTLRQTWGVSNERLLVGLVGRLDPSKGQELLIRAASQVGPECEFVIVGEETVGLLGYQPGEYLEHLKSLAKELGVEKRVHFTGYTSKIPEAMASLDVLVLPSHAEAFGLVAIEAMAMGCPVILSKGGSALEIIGDNEGGFLLDEQTSRALADKINQIIENKTLRNQLSLRGIQRVKKLYDYQNRIKQTFLLYKRLQIGHKNS